LLKIVLVLFFGIVYTGGVGRGLDFFYQFLLAEA